MSPANWPPIARHFGPTGTRFRTTSVALSTLPFVLPALVLLAAGPSWAAADDAGGVRFGAVPGGTAGRESPGTTGKPRPADFTAVDVTPGGSRDPAPPLLEPTPAARPASKPTTNPSAAAPSTGGGPPGSSDLTGLLSDNLLSRTVPNDLPAVREGSGSSGAGAAGGAGTGSAKATAAAGPGEPVGKLGLSPVEIGVGAAAIVGMIGAGVFAWRRRA